MVDKGKTGEPKTDQLKIRIELSDEVQRNHGSVIQGLVPFAERSGREILRIRNGADPVDELLVIVFLKANLLRMKTAEISDRIPAR